MDTSLKAPLRLKGIENMAEGQRRVFHLNEGGVDRTRTDGYFRHRENSTSPGRLEIRQVFEIPQKAQLVGSRFSEWAKASEPLPGYFLSFVADRAATKCGDFRNSQIHVRATR
jgi:hypothetical protein